VFAEVFADPSRLEQIRQEVTARNWRIDCVGYQSADPFLRVQLPRRATLTDVEYFAHVPKVSAVRMVYETQPKELCPRSMSGAPGSPAANPPMTEKMYREAARHCHSKEVIRMRPGVSNVFYVGGLTDSRGRPSGEDDAKRIECVRQYLGVPSKDVRIVFS